MTEINHGLQKTIMTGNDNDRNQPWIAKNDNDRK